MCFVVTCKSANATVSISIHTGAVGCSFSPELIRQNLRAGVGVEKVSSQLLHLLLY